MSRWTLAAIAVMPCLLWPAWGHAARAGPAAGEVARATPGAEGPAADAVPGPGSASPGAASPAAGAPAGQGTAGSQGGVGRPVKVPPALVPERRPVEQPPEPRQEFGVVPVIGGDSDVGFTFGIAGALTHFEAGRRPYMWRVDAAAVTSVQPAQNTVTHQDYHVGIAVPGLAGGPLRLDSRVGFTRFDNGEYHGLGDHADAPSTSREFGLLYPEVRLDAQVIVWKALVLLGGVVYRHVWPEVSPTGTLAAHLADPTPLERALLIGTNEHSVLALTTGVAWDTRDSDVSPTRGAFSGASLELAPSLGGSFAYGFWGFDVAGEYYRRLAGRRLVLATRLILDVVTGRPPFYELARLRDATPAPGGGKAVRGVPEYRYFGKTKVVANVELRYATGAFTVLKQSLRVGPVAFVDAGRVWAEFLDDPDARGLGLKVGLGGGVRLYWGEGFVLRGDIAWSPDARPIAFYFNVDQAF